MLRSCVIAAVLLAWTGSAGSDDPVMMRTVTMNGLIGPAYYSKVEQGYRFIGGAPSHQFAVAVDSSIAISSLDESADTTANGTSLLTAPSTAGLDSAETPGQKSPQQGS